MSRIARNVLSIAIVAATVSALLSGCTGKGPVFVDAGTTYTNTTALAMLNDADTSRLASRPTADGVKMRHAALAALRREGSDASSVADLLTKTFPSSTTGVPVYVERCQYEGKPAVLVVEAAGPNSGTLSAKRLWVVGENGDILLAGSR